MEEVLNRLKGLSADELREEFARADLKCGPITATTRATFERKLARVLVGPESNATETDTSSSAGLSGSAVSVADHTNLVSGASSAVAPTAAATSSSLPEAACEELDFGYGVGLNPPEEEEISLKMSSNTCSEGRNSQSKTETPSKPAQVSPTFYYGVCPLWEDVLSRNGMRISACYIVTSNRFCCFILRVRKRYNSSEFLIVAIRGAGAVMNIVWKSECSCQVPLDI